ncbi:unnamed protein product [Symbiodinium sp. CCMP2592]|nr:unnamed protein product [Symbiodinium sp. CCMP2592]
MNARELQSLYADLSQRLNVPVSGQFVPERLGQSPPDLNVPAFVRHQGNTLPGVPAENARSSEDKDVFSRSEKWLGSPPSPNHQAWKGRESEVLGMNAYIHELVAWANQASVEFGKEIAQAARWPTQIAWNTLSKSQQARGVRLFSVLKAAFADHGRITLMIQSFGEGLDIVAVAMQGDVFGYESQGDADGKNVSSAGLVSSSLCLRARKRIRYIIRKVRHMPHIDLQLCDGNISSVCSPEAGEGMDGHVFGMSARPSDAGSGVKCNRCGKKGHQVNQCTADLSKVKCFKCGEMGHISLNCAKGKQGDVSQSSARPKGSDGKGAAAAKGQETGVWWYTDADESFYTEEGDDQETQQVDATLVLSCVIESTDEPNTRFEAVLEDSESVSVVLQEQLCQPLLQSLGQSPGSEFWLLDSGASCCVINHVTLKTLPHDELTACGSTFMAANGTPVPFDGRCHVVLKVRTKDSSGATKNGVCKIPVMVGDTPYNILSTRTLGRHGWRVVLDEGVSVCQVKSGVDMIDTCIWCDTPWIRVIPHSEGDLLLPLDASVDPAPISSIGHVAVVSQKTKEDLEIHRAKGHMPFHPDCEHCLKSRGVTQHRRKSERGVETEIVADFMFLDSSGETISVAERQTSSSFKVLVLREAFSSSIGAVMITENIAKDRGLLLKWLAEFGLSSSQASIVLLTDSEEAVKSFVAGASDKYIFMVRKAAPQAHEQLGGAERTVRVLKEGLATPQSDFQSLGCVLSFRRDLLQLALSYLCMSVNANGKAFGGERSPKEVAVGRRLPDTPFALFGSKVLAEVPESVKALCPNMSRFEAAAFLHPQFGSLGSLVYAHVRVGQVLTPKVFVAKSIKLVFPIELVFESGMFEVLRRRGELGPERPDHPVAPRILPSSQGASLKCPVSGPPKEFFERYGFSGECRACSNMAQFGSRKGSSHGRACCLRYEAWLRSQVATDDSMDVEVPVASDAEAMREALSELAEDESRQDRAVEEAQGSPLPPPASGDAASSEAPARIVSEAAPSGRVFTRGCPACESGMNAPGIRHNADCKRRNQHLSVRFSVSGEPDDDEALSRRLPENLEGAVAPESEGIGALDEDTEMPFADPVLTGSEGGGSLEAEEVLRGSSAVKRSSEVPLEDLEREIRQDQERVASVMVTFHNCETGNDVHMPLASFVEQAFQVSNYVPLLSGLVDSVQFAPNSTSVVLPFGKRSHLRLWKPSSAVDDSTLGELSGDQVMEGMVKEVNNLSHMETGDLLTASELQSLEKRFPGTLKVIPSRWVTTQKTPTTVRARIVIKDIAGKNSESARALGISSPTPSADALFTVLGVAGCRDCVIAGADVSHAFMATPLRERDVVMRFPLSVSSVSGDPLYLHLNKALNGLRKASQEWIYFVGETVKVLGLQSCSLEPCLFSGMLESGPCLLLVYVDDFLCIAPTKEDADHIFEVIEKKVELKRTGLINSSKDGGGTLRFIGRVISRRKGESSITVSLPEDYLDETFKAYGLSGKGSSSPPDVAVHVEKLDGVPLSPEAYARFRSALGKVAWMTQTRQDLRAYVSILATQQATPTNHTEHGLRALLRFLKNDMCVVVRLPAASDVLAPSQHYQGKRHLVCFSDASHAPLRCTKRRGISGGVLTLDGCVIKTLCRHQQLVSLSSMESELFALQSVAQEMSSLGKFMARVFMSFRESEEVELPGILYSDSESALKLLRNLDTPRQSRHLEIRVEWLKARVAAGSLVLAFKKGIENPSDLLTKCLGSSAFGIHREALGFESLSGPLASLCNHEKRLVMVEVCCRPQSSVQGACRRVGMSYVGVTENMQSDSVFKEVRRYLLNFACDCVFVHVSTPCSSGSYLRRFSGGSSSKSDWEWFEVFPCVLKYLKLGKHSSFELPWNNEIWQHDLCQKVLKKAGHTFDVPVRLGGPKQVFTLRNSLMRLFEVRTRAAMVLTTDERRELRRLLDKMDSADGLASTANTSMTDGTKRLRDVGGYPEDGSTASGSACGAQLPISKGSAKGAVSTPKCYEDLVDAFEGEEFGESDNVIVVSYAGTEVTSVPLPSDLSLEDWGRTICDLPKVQKNKMWFKKSYAALVKLAKEDSDLASYLNWIKEKFGRNYDPTTSSSQSSDLAGYLMRIGFSKQKGFQRKLAEE